MTHSKEITKESSITENKIPGGYILKAKCIRNSNIAHATPCTRETWDWLLMNAAHSDTDKLKRGQLFIRYREIIEGLSWKSGFRKMSYTNKQLERAMATLRGEGMVGVTKVVTGMLITICNYDRYQTASNYGGGNGGSHGGGKNHYKEEKKKKNIPDSDESGEIENISLKKKTKKQLETEFEIFWEKYPRKEGEELARKKWVSFAPDLAMVLSKLELFVEHKWAEKEKKYIPAGHNFVSQKRWKDEIDTPAKTTVPYQPTVKELLSDNPYRYRVKTEAELYER